MKWTSAAAAPRSSCASADAVESSDRRGPHDSYTHRPARDLRIIRRGRGRTGSRETVRDDAGPGDEAAGAVADAAPAGRQDRVCEKGRGQLDRVGYGHADTRGLGTIQAGRF